MTRKGLHQIYILADKGYEKNKIKPVYDEVQPSGNN